MKIERDYIGEIRRGIIEQNSNRIETAINDFYNVYAKQKNDEEKDEFIRIDELEGIKQDIAIIIYFKLKNHYDTLKNINGDMEMLNLDIVHFIAYTNFEELQYEISEVILNMPSENKDQKIEDDLYWQLWDIAEAFYFRENNNEKIDGIIDYEKCKIIDEKLLDLSNLIMLGFDHTSRKRKTSIKPNNKEIQDKYKIFIGNKLQKRDPVRLNKYIKVAKLLKLMEDNFNYVSGSQKIACEIADCEPASFSKWKNAREENFDNILKWQSDINEKERSELENEIEKHIKKEI